MTIDASKLEGWADALQVAKNGLEWYRNEFPQAESARDDEAHTQIDEALRLLRGAIRRARGEHGINPQKIHLTSTSVGGSWLQICRGACNHIPDCKDKDLANRDDCIEELSPKPAGLSGWDIKRTSEGVIGVQSPGGVVWFVVEGEDETARREKIGAHFYQMLSDMLDACDGANPGVCGVSCNCAVQCGDTQAHAADVNAASAEDMKVYDGIAAGYHRSTASAIDPKKMRGTCGMATSQHEGRRRITLEFDMPEDAVEAHSALSDMGWSHRSIRSEQIPSGLGQDVDPEIVNQIAAKAGFGPAAAWPEFSSVMRRFFNIAFRMGAQSAAQGGGL